MAAESERCSVLRWLRRAARELWVHMLRTVVHRLGGQRGVEGDSVSIRELLDSWRASWQEEHDARVRLEEQVKALLATNVRLNKDLAEVREWAATLEANMDADQLTGL